jgi:ligand-binding SRPBCC domain-containing protein
MDLGNSVKFINLGKVYRIESKQRLPLTLSEAWSFFSSPKNLAEITPDKLGFKILSGADTEMFTGQIIQYTVTPLPFFKATWVTEIKHVEFQKFFVDEQRYGPYSMWHHKHFFKEIEGGVEMTDIVDYVPPFGLLGRLVNPIIVKPKLVEIFEYRFDKLKQLFAEK